MKTSTADAPPRTRSPDDAWAINRLLMNWMAPVAWRGFRRPLTQDLAQSFNAEAKTLKFIS